MPSARQTAGIRKISRYVQFLRGGIEPSKILGRSARGCDNDTGISPASTNALAGESKVAPGTQKAKAQDTQTNTRTLKTFATDNKGSKGP